VARDLVTALASPTYIERAFSVGRDMYAGKYSRMSINLEQCVFQQMNQKYLTDVLL